MLSFKEKEQNDIYYSVQLDVNTLLRVQLFC